MFTGLVRTQGTIRRVDMRGDCLMTIAMREPFAIAIGDSICCDGICLTAIKVEETTFKVSLSAETLGCTTAKDWAVGTEINLEPSLRVGDHLGGHFVSGHVDATARAVAQEQSGDSTIWEFEVPPELARFIAPKGSVTVNGVSLMVNAVKERPEARGQRPGDCPQIPERHAPPSRGSQNPLGFWWGGKYPRLHPPPNRKGDSTPPREGSERLWNRCPDW